MANTLTLTPAGFKTWKLTKSFKDEDVRVPCGYETDLASIPRILWTLLPPFGRYSQAAVIHDYLYETKGIDGKYTRYEADKLFYKLMLKYGTYKWKAVIMFLAVRAFGGRWWN